MSGSLQSLGDFSLNLIPMCQNTKDSPQAISALYSQNKTTQFRGLTVRTQSAAAPSAPPDKQVHLGTKGIKRNFSSAIGLAMPPYVTYLPQASVRRFLHSNMLFRENMLCDGLQHTKKENTPRELSQSSNIFSQILSASRTFLFFQHFSTLH